MEIFSTIVLVLLALALGVPAVLVVVVAVMAVTQRTYRRIRVWRRRHRKPRWIITVTEKCRDGMQLEYSPYDFDMVLGVKVPESFATLEGARECLRKLADRYGCKVDGDSFCIPLSGRDDWTKWRIERIQ